LYFAAAHLRWLQMRCAAWSTPLLWPPSAMGVMWSVVLDMGSGHGLSVRGWPHMAHTVASRRTRALFLR
jgi:hypothetical protein